MKIRYYAETDTLYIEFRDAPVAETRDLDENTLLDVDADGDICAITVEHASKRVVQFVTDLLNPVMHYKRALSIGQAVVGTMHAGRLSSAAVGRAQARVFDITPKSGIKQVDRLLGNEQFDVEAVFQQSVRGWWRIERRSSSPWIGRSMARTATRALRSTS